MGFREAFGDVFELVRERPALFLPRIVTAVIWSFFWIFLVRGLQDPFTVDPGRAQLILGAFLLFMPVQIWVFNSYFVYMRQHRNGTEDAQKAVITAFRRTPEALGAYLVLSLVSFAAILPGAAIAGYGYVTNNSVFLILGGVVMLGLFLAVTAVTYFTPIAVVLGEGSLKENLWTGVRASRSGQRTVMILMGVSFGLLIVTSTVQGVFEAVGVIGFIAGRVIAAILSVYLLLVNPELFMDLETE